MHDKHLIRRTSSLRSPISRSIHQMAQRRAVSAADIARALDLDLHQASSRCGELAKYGWLERVDTSPVRFRALDKGAAKPAAAPTLVAVGEHLRTIHQPPSAAPPLIGKASGRVTPAERVRSGQQHAMPAQVMRYTRPDGVRVVVVERPLYDARVQCAPDERPFGAGFAAVGVGCDVTTGRPWGAR